MDVGSVHNPQQPQIYKIIYRSRIAEDGGHDAVMDHIKQILIWSRSWNQKNGITGALMLDEDGFAQVLEGPSDAVKALFGHIICDRRHKEVEVMEADHHHERDFGNWAMAFVGRTGEPDITLTRTERRDPRPTGNGAPGVIALLRWFLQEQP